MLRTFMGAIALAGAVQAVAQAPASAPADKPQVWDLEWEEPHCTITTATENGSALMVSMTPGDPEPGLYFVAPGKPIPVKFGEAATITLRPSNRTVQSTVWREVDGPRSVIRVGPVGYQFPAEFAQSDSVKLQTTSGRISIAITGADKAMAAIHDCVDKKLAEWGLDPKAYDALQKAPTEIKGYSWMDPNEYPMDALEINWNGDVVARLAVDATGKVTDCKILISGMRSVDEVTCRSALQRGRYDPAIGADGKPTPAVRVVDVAFRTIGG